MLLKLRRKVFRLLRDRGIEIRKAPAGSWQAISVFHLAAEALMAKRGEALRFVQIGANDGVISDPIRAYILERGWHGLLVEPQPDVFARLTQSYAGQAERLTFAQVAVGPEGTLTLYRPPSEVAETANLALVSADPTVIARSLGISASRLERINVPSIPLNQLLDRHGVTAIDVLQIDVEGLDWTILKTLDFERFQPTLIQFESGHMPRVQITEATRTLNALGYDVHYGGWQGDMVALRIDWNTRGGEV